VDTTSFNETPTYYNVTLSSDFYDYVDASDTYGLTRIVLRSDREIASTEPEYSEQIYISTYENGEANSPKLYVSYETVDYAYRYILHGPYYEDGTTPASTNVTVTLYSRYTTPVSFTMPNGTSTYTVEAEERPNHFMWNLTSGSYNITRFYWLTETSFEDIYLKPTTYTTSTKSCSPTSWESATHT
jgi:hypothetical protein